MYVFFLSKRRELIYIDASMRTIVLNQKFEKYKKEFKIRNLLIRF
jgi:hypothetical protein